MTAAQTIPPGSEVAATPAAQRQDRADNASVLVHVAGEFDIGTQPVLRQALSRAHAADVDVLLDLSEVTFVDASSLGVLMDTHRALAERGHTFRIVNPARAVARVLALTDLTAVLMPASAR
jgi:anti-anti-sigma factor